MFSNFFSIFRSSDGLRIIRKLKSLQINHFLNKDLQEFNTFPNYRNCLPDAFLCRRCHSCDRCMKRWAIQRCEDISGCARISIKNSHLQRLNFLSNNFLSGSWGVVTGVMGAFRVWISYRLPELPDLFARCISLPSMPFMRSIHETLNNMALWGYRWMCSYWSGLLLG